MRRAATNKHSGLHINIAVKHVAQCNDFNFLMRPHGPSNNADRCISVPVPENDFAGSFQLPVSFFALGIIYYDDEVRASDRFRLKTVLAALVDAFGSSRFDGFGGGQTHRDRPPAVFGSVSAR